MHDSLLDPDPETEIMGFDEWLETAESESILTVFEDDIYESTNALTEIAVGQVLTAYQYTFHGSTTWDAYWGLYYEWVKNWISDDARQDLLRRYESWCAEQ